MDVRRALAYLYFIGEYGYGNTIDIIYLFLLRAESQFLFIRARRPGHNGIVKPEGVHAGKKRPFISKVF